MQIGVQHICRSTLCGTRVVLAAPDRDTAQWWADSLGRSEVEEVAEGYSYGANTIRDGVSLTPRRELRTLALPSKIMRLANLEGYLKFTLGADKACDVADFGLAGIGRRSLRVCCPSCRGLGGAVPHCSERDGHRRRPSWPRCFHRTS